MNAQDKHYRACNSREDLARGDRAQAQLIVPHVHRLPQAYRSHHLRYVFCSTNGRVYRLRKGCHCIIDNECYLGVLADICG